MIKISGGGGKADGKAGDKAGAKTGKGGKGAKAASKVKVSFVLPLSEAPEPVSVLGDFNGWDPLAHPLKKRSNGTRSATVELEPGRRYSFKYLADGGTWFTDPEADEHQVNEYGETNGILEV